MRWLSAVFLTERVGQGVGGGWGVLVIGALCFLGLGARAAPLTSAKSYDFSPRRYFLEDPARTLKPPYVTPAPRFIDRLISEELISEFQKRFDEQIGGLEASRISPSLPESERMRVGEDVFAYRAAVVEESKAMDALGEFMARRIVEVNLDRRLKQDPKTKAIYQAKERITNAEAKVSPQVTMKARYSISGNYALLGAYLKESQAILRWEMKSLKDGPFVVDDVVYVIRQTWTPKVDTQIYYRVYEKYLKFILRRRLSATVVASLTAAELFEGEDSRDANDSVILGVNWVF